MYIVHTDIFRGTVQTFVKLFLLYDRTIHKAAQRVKHRNQYQCHWYTFYVKFTSMWLYIESLFQGTVFYNFMTPYLQYINMLPGELPKYWC